LRIPARRDVGQLRLDDGEHMTLHTRDALSLFAGRAAVKGSAAQAIVGGRRFAAAMRSLWLLSGDDNPYADWMLLRADAALQAVHEHLARTGATLEAELTRLRQRGLSCQVLASARPVSVSLGFASPYGFATAEAIVEFDHHVRMVRTLVLRNRMSDAQGRQAVRDAGRRLRALFLEPIRWERTLLREDLRPLSRADFVPGADTAAAQRVMTVQDELGLLPRDVLSGERAPRHSRRPLRAGAPRGTAGPAAAGRPEPRGIDLFPTIDPVWTEVGGYAAAATTESDVDPFDPFLGAEPRDLI
jgi:integrating conjugative element protein (TIGR03761 family)